MSGAVWSRFLELMMLVGMWGLEQARAVVCLLIRDDMALTEQVLCCFECLFGVCCVLCVLLERQWKKKTRAFSKRNAK